jgi:hypothetical protein
MVAEHPTSPEYSGGTERPGGTEGALHHSMHTRESAATQHSIQLLLVLEHPGLMAQHPPLVSRNPALESHDSMIDVSAGLKVHS